MFEIKTLKKHQLIFIFILFLALLAGLVFYVSRQIKPSASSDILAIDESLFTFKEQLPAEEYQETVKRLQALKAKLKIDPGIAGDWFNFGYYKNYLGDREGARLAWEKALAINASHFATVNNLADIYANFIPDYPRAELLYMKALYLKPNYYDTYIKLADLYRHGLKEKENKIEELLLGAAQASKANEIYFFDYLFKYYESLDNATKTAEYRNKILKIDPQYFTKSQSDMSR